MAFLCKITVDATTIFLKVLGSRGRCVHACVCWKKNRGGEKKERGTEAEAMAENPDDRHCYVLVSGTTTHQLQSQQTGWGEEACYTPAFKCTTESPPQSSASCVATQGVFTKHWEGDRVKQVSLCLIYICGSWFVTTKGYKLRVSATDFSNGKWESKSG